MPREVVPGHQTGRHASSDGRPAPGSRWYAGRTRARAEKTTHRILEESGVDAYLPVVEREQRWADRRKRVTFPLFPGYLFVRFARNRISTVLSTPGLIDVVRQNGEPTPVREAEIATVRTLVEGVRLTGELPKPVDYLTVGRAVEIVHGPFAGLCGTLIEERGRVRVAVRLSVIRQAVTIELDRRCLRPARMRAPRAPGLRRYSG